MKKIIKYIKFSLILFLLCSDFAIAQSSTKIRSQNIILGNGTEINKEGLQRILNDHKELLNEILPHGLIFYTKFEPPYRPKYNEMKDQLTSDDRYADLSNIELKNVNLSNATLLYADFSNASFYSVNLSNAYLYNSNMSNAYLDNVNLNNAELEYADLSNVYSTNVDLNNASLSATNMFNSTFYKSSFHNAFILLSNLRNADLSNSNFKNTYFGCDADSPKHSKFLDNNETNLNNTNFNHANLQKAKLGCIDICNSSFKRSNLENAYLSYSNIISSKFIKSNLKNSNFVNATVDYSNFYRSDITGSNIKNIKGFPVAKHSGYNDITTNPNKRLPNYEPKAGTHPNIPSMVNISSLEMLTYDLYPYGLITLRENFKQYGYEKHARKITYALEHTATINLIDSDKWTNKIKGYSRLFLFEYTCNWGMSPGKPMLILVFLICVFSFPYMLALLGLSEKHGIWYIGKKDISMSYNGEIIKKIDISNSFFNLAYAPYFSLLSAVYIGWRDINVRNWVTKIQPFEHTLKANGWVRTLSGIQSLISVYLLALTVLTYFGNPFAQF